MTRVRAATFLRLALGALLALTAAFPAMTYATKQNLIDRFGEQELVELTNRAGGALIDDAVLDRALADADAEVNGYLAVKYALPLAVVPAVLEPVACDIARYYLYEDRVTEQVMERYKARVAFLSGVAKGHVNLGVDAASQAPASSGGPQHEAPDRVFTGDTLADY